MPDALTATPFAPPVPLQGWGLRLEPLSLAHTAGLQPHRDLGCARIQCVVQQLAHDGSRTLNDFARSDLTDQLVR